MGTPEFNPPKENRPAGDNGSPERRANARPHGSRTVTPHSGHPVAADDPARFPLTPRQLEACARAALRDDGALDDLATAACVLSTRRAHGTIVARQGGVVAGVPLAITLFQLLDPNVAIRVDVDDGGTVGEGGVIMRITGLAHAILTAERLSLGFLQRLSGVSTFTAGCVSAIAGTKARIVNARVMAPGIHGLEQYAARAGGASDRRQVLADLVQVSHNHVAAVDGDIAFVVRRARELAPRGTRVEIACRSPGEVRTALEEGVEAILMERMTAAQAGECVALARERAITEASGPMSLDTMRALAAAGVDYIAADALTQRADALDIALEFEAAY